MVILKSIFFKNLDHEDPFHVQWYEGENEIICGHVETSKVMINVQNTIEVRLKMRSGYVVQYLINGTMKTVFYE